MIENLKKRADNIYYHGPQDVIDVALIASFIFICIAYVFLLIACMVWAIGIPLIAITHKSIAYLLWWIPCIASIAILIAVGCFVTTALNNL